MSGRSVGSRSNPGSDADGVGVINLWTSETEKTEYASIAYPLFYGTGRSETEGIAHLHLSKAERLKASSPLVARYHLAGTFQFNAAYRPEPLSEACTHEAIMASGRIPMYNASVCDAKKNARHGLVRHR
jgi:hypothetical protein